jgi:hypothetical protein
MRVFIEKRGFIEKRVAVVAGRDRCVWQQTGSTTRAVEYDSRISKLIGRRSNWLYRAPVRGAPIEPPNGTLRNARAPTRTLNGSTRRRTASKKRLLRLVSLLFMRCPQRDAHEQECEEGGRKTG